VQAGIKIEDASSPQLDMLDDTLKQDNITVSDRDVAVSELMRANPDVIFGSSKPMTVTEALQRRANVANANLVFSETGIRGTIEGNVS
jgi:hypothetical protein